MQLCCVPQVSFRPLLGGEWKVIGPGYQDVIHPYPVMLTNEVQYIWGVVPETSGPGLKRIGRSYQPVIDSGGCIMKRILGYNNGIFMG